MTILRRLMCCIKYAADILTLLVVLITSIAIGGILAYTLIDAPMAFLTGLLFLFVGFWLDYRTKEKS